MIGIVGAGITGLSLGVFLDARGVDYEVLESTGRSGGVIRSSAPEGRVLDHGPQRTRVTPPVAEMIRILGLGDRMVQVPPDIPLFVFRRGKLRQVPFRPGDLLRTDLLTVGGKLRLLLEPFTGPYRRGETVGEFLTRKFGREAYEGVMGPLFGGLYGSDPGEMYVRHSLAETMGSFGVSKSIMGGFLMGRFNRAATPPATSFVNGMQEFTDAMAAKVGERLHLGCGAIGLRPAEPGGAPGGAGGLGEMGEKGAPGGRGEMGASGWIVTTQAGDERRYDQVVITIPAEPAAALLAPVSEETAQRLDHLRYNRLAMVHMVGECDLHGLGYQVGYGEGLRTRGVTWNASALGRDGVYTAFLGGARDPGMLERTDEEIGETARTEFEAVTGCRARVVAVNRTRVPSWDRSWEALEGMELPAGLHLCTNYESRVGIPGRLARARGLAAALAAGSGAT
jgi:protoporphyrinogen/coproporphyrinogen III oxidase